MHSWSLFLLFYSIKNQDFIKMKNRDRSWTVMTEGGELMMSMRAWMEKSLSLGCFDHRLKACSSDENSICPIIEENLQKFICFSSLTEPA